MGDTDVTVIITKYEPDALIEWTISGAIQPPLRHLYGYRLQPSDGGTLVTAAPTGAKSLRNTATRGFSR